MGHDSWKIKLRPFDAQLCKMVESLTGTECEPKLGGKNEYFIVVDYSKHKDSDIISALMDAVAGRAGDRLIEMNDDAENRRFIAHIRFYEGECEDAKFIPKIDN